MFGFCVKPLELHLFKICSFLFLIYSLSATSSTFQQLLTNVKSNHAFWGEMSHTAPHKFSNITILTPQSMLPSSKTVSGKLFLLFDSVPRSIRISKIISTVQDWECTSKFIFLPFVKTLVSISFETCAKHMNYVQYSFVYRKVGFSP